MSLQYLSSNKHDLGGFSVRRALPSAERQAVGPFVFFDHIGPAVLEPGVAVDVRPHPHIGLATVTYLFEGQIVHRDSLGEVQPIRPGAVNWMVAGRGIVHSERSSEEDRDAASPLHGIQLWVALPQALEETAPSFTHYPADNIPLFEKNGVEIRVITGSEFGVTSPVLTQSPMFYCSLVTDNAAGLTLPARNDERALYVASGEARLDGETVSEGQMVFIEHANDIKLELSAESRVLYFGGEALDGPRVVHWNFVSSRRERITQARDDWANGRFDSVPGETEFIPLPPSKRFSDGEDQQ